MKRKSDAERIAFFPDEQIMEVDFSDMTFEVSSRANAFYDEMDRQIVASGKKWFFLVNYFNTRIMAEGWITFAHRGKKSNIAYSLGSARYAVSPDVGEAVLRRAEVEDFDPSLFASREAAVEHLYGLRAKMTPEEFGKAVVLTEPEPRLPMENRVTFHPELQIMEVDFTDVSFERSDDVNAFYDLVESRLAETGEKWYFLVNYRNCEIMPEAWMAFATRGKKINLSHSLGTVRCEARETTGRQIVRESESQNFDPNIVPDRDAAIDRIAALRAAAGKT